MRFLSLLLVCSVFSLSNASISPVKIPSIYQVTFDYSTFGSYNSSGTLQMLVDGPNTHLIVSPPQNGFSDIVNIISPKRTCLSYGADPACYVSCMNDVDTNPHDKYGCEDCSDQNRPWKEFEDTARVVVTRGCDGLLHGKLMNYTKIDTKEKIYVTSLLCWDEAKARPVSYNLVSGVINFKTSVKAKVTAWSTTAPPASTWQVPSFCNANNTAATAEGQTITKSKKDLRKAPLTTNQLYRWFSQESSTF